MRIHVLASLLATAGVAASGILPATLIPSATAQPCPDVEVIFARGTGEPPGVGAAGQAFLDALRPLVGAKTLEVHPVTYPATNEWSTGIDGIRDAGAHVVSMAGACPRTKMVLGGYSQGAAIAGFVTSPAVPAGVDPATVPKPLQPNIADHVAAVALFGLPNTRAMNFLGEPPVTVGPLYQAKTIELCAVDDPVCSDGLNFSAHSSPNYVGELTQQGAAFVADRVNGQARAR